MDPLLISAASGMKARMQSLDMLANNVANAGTVGFKADREFYNLYQNELPMIEGRWTDYSQGPLTANGNPLSLALSGPGFFAVNGPDGVAYTRSGTLQISKNNQLVTAQGYPLRDALAANKGLPIQIDPTQPVVIDKTGAVFQGGQEVGQIEVDALAGAQLETQSALSKLGSTYFALATPSAGAAPNPASAPAAPAAPPEILQGYLEQSNVNPTDSAVRLVNVMRQFEMLQRAMTIGAQMDKEAIQDVARLP